MSTKSHYLYSTVCLSLLLVCGCQVGKDYTPAAIPESHAAQLTLPTAGHLCAITQWWRTFNDPMLDSLIESALTSNPDLKVAYFKLYAARALRDSSDSKDWPSLTASGAYTESKSRGAKEGGWQSNVTTSLDVNWELDLFGSVAYQQAASNAQWLAQRYSLEHIRVSLAAEVALAYFSLRQNAEQLVLSQQMLKLRTDSVSIAQKRFDAGSVTKFELLNAQASLADLRASLPNYQKAIQSAILEIEFLTGQSPNTLAQRLLSYVNQAASSRFPEIQGIRFDNNLLRNRPDIAQAEQLILEQHAQLGIQKTNLYPKFALGGSLGVSAPDLSPWSGYTQTLSLGPRFSWNIFAFGKWRQLVTQNEFLLKASIESYQKTILSAYQKTEDTWQTLNNQLKRTDSLQSVIDHRKEALTVALRRFDNGTISLDDVISGESNLVLAQNAFVSHHYAALSTLITLYKNLGGGWVNSETNAPATNRPQ